MQILNKEIITPSLLKQFNNKQILISEDFLSQAVQQSFSGYIDSYNSLKIANGELHKIVKEDINIKRTQLLSMIAVSQGYENHHALKNKFDTSSEELKTDLSQITNDMHPLKKLYMLKNEMYKLLKMPDKLFHGINIEFDDSERVILFSLAHMDESDIHPKQQAEINELLTKYDLKVSQNKVVIPWSYSSSNPEPAVRIIEHFRAFFYPRYIMTNNNVEHAAGKKIMISINDVKSLFENVVINDAVADTPTDTVITALQYCFNSKFHQNMDTFTDIINGRYIKSNNSEPVTMDYAIEMLNYTDVIRESSLNRLGIGNTLMKYMTEISLFEPLADLIPTIKEFEKSNNIDIGDFVREAVLEYMNENKKDIAGHSFKFETILKNVSLALTGKHLEDIQHDDSKKSHIIYKSLKNIVYEIERDVEFLTQAIINPQRNF